MSIVRPVQSKSSYGAIPASGQKLFYISFSQSEWRNVAKDFASDQSNVQVLYVNAPHDLYHAKKEEVLSQIEDFLEQ